MIPKIIHYCWFGGRPLPPLAEKCISSWRKFLPNYEIKRWDENNFDVNAIPYTQEAYQAGKYAFVSDYARFWILYRYGGLYFDTDVEVIRSMDKIVDRGPFMGWEKRANDKYSMSGVNPGLGLGVTPGLDLYKQVLDRYERLTFDLGDDPKKVQTVVHHTTHVLLENGLKRTDEIQNVAGIWIYPKEYFNPMESGGLLRITDQTVSIHHYAASWIEKKVTLKSLLIKLLGGRLTHYAVLFKRRLRRSSSTSPT